MNEDKKPLAVCFSRDEIMFDEILAVAVRHDWTISKTCAHLVRLGLIALGCDGGEPDDLA